MRNILFKNRYTFKDVLLEPKASFILPEDEITTRSRLCKDIFLNVPFISAAMDTVTESVMAITMAKNGALGIIHRNLSVADQCEQVKQVKRHTGTFVKDPITLLENATIEDALNMSQNHFTTIPIVNTQKQLVGLVTKTDLEDCGSDLQKEVTEIMVPFNQLVIAESLMQSHPQEAYTLMKNKRVKCLPLVTSQENPILRGIYFKKDLVRQTQQSQHMSVDQEGHLLVGAAIGVGEEGYERAKALVDAGVDILCIDTAQGHSVGVRDILIRLKKDFPHVPVIAGNVVTQAGAQFLIDAGADAIKVGVGPGAICTTREVTGNGMPQFSAILEVAEVTYPAGIPLIADGGIQEKGDISKALAAGANAIMMGSVFAGTDEAPGELLEDTSSSVKYKLYRGMGSIEAMNAQGGIANDRYLSKSTKKVPEGITGKVLYKGSVVSVIESHLNALIQTMRTYQGSSTIEELQVNPQFSIITSNGVIENTTRVL